MELSRCRLAHGDLGDHRCAWCGGALPPRHRRWCSDLCMRIWRANHFWSFARLAALERDGFRCVICRDPEDPEVHHKVPVGKRGYVAGCRHHLDNLEVLCHAHHVEADAARRHAAKGEPVQLSLIAA